MTTQATQTKSTTVKYDSVFECPRCSGKGWLPEFRHVKNGVCFLCGGNKVIETRKQYPKQDKIVCRFTKGHCHMYDDDMKLIWQYREAIAVSFDGGERFLSGGLIDDSNRDKMRSLWVWCQNNGAEMIIEDEDANSVDDDD